MKIFRRALIDGPTVLIALGGVLLWALWPAVHLPGEHERLPATGVFHLREGQHQENPYKSPLMFALPSAMGFGASDESGGMPAVPKAPAERPPRFLARKETPQADPRQAATAHVPGNAAESMSGYRPRWDMEPIFDVDAKMEMRLTVVPRGGLIQCGFTLPDEYMARLRSHERPWSVTVVIETGDEGRACIMRIRNWRQSRAAQASEAHPAGGDA